MLETDKLIRPSSRPIISNSIMLSEKLRELTVKIEIIRVCLTVNLLLF